MDGKIGKKSDVYSFAIMIWRMVTGASPFEGQVKTRFELEQKVKEGVRPKIPDECPNPLSKLIQQSWRPSFQERPTFEDIVDRLSEMRDKLHKNANQ